MSDFPITVTQAGAQPTPPATLLTNLITNVSAQVPGYTANLPPALITDLSSTAVGALALIDSAFVDLINSCSAYGANIPLLAALGTTYGVSQGIGSNTAVYVIFSGPAGFVIPKGLVVSDGNYQYSVQASVAIPTSGQTVPVYCLASTSGSWAVPAGTVTAIITSIPSGITITCTNTTAGTPGLDAQAEEDYRAQVMTAGMFASQGTPDALKTALGLVSGVSTNLISYRMISAGQWVVSVVGGDPYAVGQAIYSAIPDISVLTNDVTSSTGIALVKQSVSINDSPDTYTVPFIVPSSQSVAVIIVWNTIPANLTTNATMTSLVVSDIVDYINGIATGEPISIGQIKYLFKKDISNIASPSQFSLLNISVAINGVVVNPTTNTDFVYGDSYGYLTTSSSLIDVSQYE